jgi:multicomponent Na+:H+ antiporter subunit D
LSRAASALAVAPVLVPLATAFATALAAPRPRLQRRLSFAGAGLLLGAVLALCTLAAAGAELRVVFGGWPWPFGIEFAIDRVAAVLVLVTALLGSASLLFLASDADPAPAHPSLLPQLHGLLAGVGGAFVTADLFNLYVWLEVILICSFGLLALGGGLRHLDATLRYLMLNLFGTLLLLMSVALFYGATGHLNYAALARAAQALEPGLLLPLLASLTLAFLVKAGAFPLFAWLPAAYPVLPAAVLALFAGLLTKVGVYAVLRTLGDVFAPVPALLTEALGWIAAASMLTGVLGAAYHTDIRRILAFHIISQVGYILLGVALASPAGSAATLFYTVHHILVKANLFLIGGMIFRLAGHYDLRRIGGLYAARPALAVLFLVPAMSLVGLPPLSGFWAKLLVLREAIAQGRVAWTAVALVVSGLTLYSMLKVWLAAFWKAHPEPDWRPPAARLGPAWAATLGLALATLALGLLPQGLIDFSLAAASTLGAR